MHVERRGCHDHIATSAGSHQSRCWLKVVMTQLKRRVASEPCRIPDLCVAYIYIHSVI